MIFNELDVIANFNRLEALDSVFPELSDSELHALDKAATVKTYPAGASICKEGETGSTIYILGEGKIRITSQSCGPEEIILYETYAPHYFGEVALFGDGTRSATIYADTDCQVLEITHTAFRTITYRNVALQQTLFDQLSDQLRNSDRAIINQLRLKNAALQAAYRDIGEQEQQRMEFVATLSHELRTPLTSIQGFLHLMTKGSLTGNALDIGLGTINRNVEKMVWLVNNLMVLYEMHLISPKFTRLNLADLVAEAIKEAQATQNQDINHITFDIDAQLHDFQGDKAGLTLALRSLIDNAIKFSPSEAPITIRAYQIDNQYVGIDVIDQGVGIPEPIQRRIFEPFFRLDKEGADHVFSGLGIGLSIAQFIINQHGGKIKVKSQPEEGSVFSVALPISASQPAVLPAFNPSNLSASNLAP